MRSFLFLSLFLPVATAFQALAPVSTTTATATSPNNPRHLVSNSLQAVDPTQAWEAYNAALATDPLLVKSVTAGVILGLPT